MAFLTWTIGPIPIRLYGLMIGLGFLIGILLAARQANREGVDPDLVVDLGVYLLLTAIAGSRMFFVLANLGEFAANPLDAFALWEGGLVFYGGLLAAIPVGVWYLKKHRLPLWKTADIAAPSLALGQAVGSIGCFFAGCCYGTPYGGPASVTFHDVHSLAPLGVPLFPAQLVESGGDFVIFAMLVLFRRHKKFDGQLFWFYALSYAVLRFALEFFRGDAVRGPSFGNMVSTSQIIAAVMVVLAGIMIRRLSRKPVQPGIY